MKKIWLLFIIVISVFTLISCEEQIDPNMGVTYPIKPYEDSDHILLKDPYAFYNLAGNVTNYWNSANTHDPAIIKEGEFYYSFSTDANFGVTSQKGIHIRKSNDLIHWEFVGTALDLTTVQEQIDYVGYNNEGNLVDFFWAPDIIKRGNEFWLFYSNSGFGSRNSYMGLAKSTNIEGPYVFDKEILRTHPSLGGTPNAIDPAIFTEFVGSIEKMYVTYGSWSAGIYIKELNPENGHPLIEQSLELREVTVQTSTPGVTTKVNKLVPILSNDPAFGTKILSITTSEAPYLIKENDYYYLFITNGVDLTYDYDVRVFRSESILGPYVDGKGQSALSPTTYQSFRPYGNKITIAHQFGLNPDLKGYNRGWAAIGHSTAFKDGDDWFFASHYRGTHMDKDRFFLGVRKMHFVDGWPILETNRYTGEGSIDLTKANISGIYRIQILHQALVNSTLSNNMISIVNKAEEIELTNNAINGWFEVRGDYEGRYRINDGFVELEINGQLYKGIVTPQFSYELEKGVLSLSLINEDGVSLWANRYR